MPKPFLTYQQQLQKLIVDKNLVVVDGQYAEEMLKLVGYYALISGYKHPYRNPTTQKYKDGTTFEEIVALYKFDENLRELFLKYLFKIERHLRSLLSYYFTEHYGESYLEYLNPCNYNSAAKHRNGVRRLVDKLRVAGQSNVTPHIVYQRETHGNVPLWVLVNALSFGTVSKMYFFLPFSLQSKISKVFGKINERELKQYLAVLTKFRNVCAHNERLFSYKSTDSIPDTLLHKKLCIPKRGTQYIYGKGDLFAVVIAFRYLLPKDDFFTFKRDFGRIIEHFVKQTIHVTEDDLLELMGFPENWKKISAYTV